MPDMIKRCSIFFFGLLMWFPVRSQTLDYSLEKNWYALALREDAADVVPEFRGLKDQQESAVADVFYIHPTTYFKRIGRNDNFMSPSSRRISRSVVMNQASAFNGCYKIYAPRYRQAASWVLKKRDVRTVNAMDIAYRDIEAAFDFFVLNNQPRPFVIAAHGQGSYHALRLLQNRIDKTSLKNLMVAAYLGGIPLTAQYADSIFDNLQYCNNAEMYGCYLNWQTLGEDGYYKDMEKRTLLFESGAPLELGDDRLCVNPLTWKADTTFASAMHHEGSMKFSGNQKELRIVMENHLSGRVKNGYMYISKPKGSLFNATGKNYHIYDYNIFYLNIRTNSCERLEQWFNQPVKSE